MLSFEEKSQIKETLLFRSVSIWDSHPQQIPRYRIGEASNIRLPVFMFGEDMYLGTKKYTKGKAKKFDLLVYCHEEHIPVHTRREKYCKMLNEIALKKFQQYIYDHFPRSDLGEPISVYGRSIEDGKFIVNLGYLGRTKRYVFKLPFGVDGNLIKHVNERDW